MKKLLHFSAPSWCVPCQKTQPIVDSFIKNNSDIEYKYVDVDNDSKTAFEYQVLGVPTFIFYRDGKQVNRHVGIITEGQLNSFFN
jgi:thioredoxin 1